MFERLQVFGEDADAAARLSIKERKVLVGDRIAARRPLEWILRGIVVLICHY
jgi:hypothetical protein